MLFRSPLVQQPEKVEKTEEQIVPEKIVNYIASDTWEFFFPCLLKMDFYRSKNLDKQGIEGVIEHAERLIAIIKNFKQDANGQFKHTPSTLVFSKNRGYQKKSWMEPEREEEYRKMDNERYLISDRVTEAQWKHNMGEAKFPRTYQELSPFLKKLDLRLPKPEQARDNELVECKEIATFHEWSSAKKNLIEAERQKFQAQREKRLGTLVGLEEKLRIEEEKLRKEEEKLRKTKKTYHINTYENNIRGLRKDIEKEKEKEETKKIEHQLEMKRGDHIRMIEENFQYEKSQVYKKGNDKFEIWVEFYEDRTVPSGDLEFTLRKELPALKFRCIFRVD